MPTNNKKGFGLKERGRKVAALVKSGKLRANDVAGPKMANLVDPETGESMLVVAALWSDNASAVEILIDQGADLRKHGARALEAAAEMDHVEVARVLAGRKEVDIEMGRDDLGSTPLIMAANSGANRVTKVLLEAGADIERACRKDGATPLLAACFRGHLEVAKTLVRYGAEINRVVAKGEATALYGAAQNGYLDIVKFLFENGADLNNGGKYDPVHVAAQYGQAHVMEWFSLNKVDLNAQSTGGTPLCLAAQAGHVDVVRLLIQKNVLLNEVDENGRTAVFVATDLGHLDVVQELATNKKTDLNKTGYDTCGISPAYVAAERGYLDILKVLIKNGAEIDSPRPDNGSTPLHVSVYHDRLDVVKWLSEQPGVDIDRFRTDDMVTPVCIAAFRRSKDVLRVLCENGADVDKATVGGNVPIMVAAHYGFNDIADILLQYNADVNKYGKSFATAVYAAASAGHADVVRSLVKAGAKVDIPCVSSYGMTPIMAASVHGHEAAVAQLIQAGADLEATNLYNKKPIHAALKHGYADIVCRLVAAGACLDDDLRQSNIITDLVAQGRLRVCQACGNIKRQLPKCSRCRAVFFCNPACAKAGWKDHKAACKAACAARGGDNNNKKNT